MGDYQPGHVSRRNRACQPAGGLPRCSGYSSTCVPSILSGRKPVEHRNWNYFVYDPANSPFRSLRFLRWLPSFVTGRRVLRRLLSRLIKNRLSFRGYFDLYNIPFKQISLYNFTETKSPLQPGGMNRGPNIFDYLVDQNIPYFVSDPGKDEFSNLAALAAEIRSERIDFAFSMLARLGWHAARLGESLPGNFCQVAGLRGLDWAVAG